MTESSVVAHRRLPRIRTDMAYVCARLRAWSTRLLPAGIQENLRALPTLAELFPALLPTDYGPQLKAWVLDVNDPGEWETALTATFARRVNRVRSLIEDSVPGYAYLVDGEWDVHHLRALLRRMSRTGAGVGFGAVRGSPDPAPQATDRSPESGRPAVGGFGDAGRPAPSDAGRPAPSETKADAPAVGAEFVPLGTFTRARYREALSAGSPDELCARLEPWLPSWADALRSFLEPPREPAITLRELELWLDDEHFRRLGRCARRVHNRDDVSIIRCYVTLLADLANLRTSLRFLGRRLPPEQIQALYLRGGSLSEATFAAMLDADGVEQIYRQLPRGPLTAVLDRGLLTLASTGRTSVFERPGDEQVLRLVHRLARRCPVSVAVPVDYLARSRNEWLNLKMIACGIHYGLPVGKVREGLVYV